MKLKIFEIIGELEGAIDKYESDYSSSYAKGYRACISDMKGKIQEKIRVEIK